MKRMVFVLFLVGLALGCATSPSQKVDDADGYLSVPHTGEDISRRYAASLATVFDACKLAIKDIGADYLEPTFELMETNAAIIASTKTRLYRIGLLGFDDNTDVLLFLEDKSSDDVISKSVFDEFWAALETHL